MTAGQLGAFIIALTLARYTSELITELLGLLF